MIPGGSRGRRGFTLVELLVVIGIVAALVAILLPTLSSVRRSSQSVADAANLRQIVTLAHGYAGDSKGGLPLGMLARDASGEVTDTFTAGTTIDGIWADFLHRWAGEEGATGDLWQSPAASFHSPTPQYGANPIAMPSPLGFTLRVTGHRPSEYPPSKLVQLHADTALFWSSSAYEAEATQQIPAFAGYSGIDDGLAYGAYSGRGGFTSRRRDRRVNDPHAADPLLAASESILVYDADAGPYDPDRDFAGPLTLRTILGEVMPARFRDGRCNVATADGAVRALGKGKLRADGTYDTEFRRFMLLVRPPA